MMILIPTYNSEKIITNTLQSALDQDLDVEICVVDNCSTDKTLDIVAKYKNIKIYKNKRNIGRIENWNRCLEIVSSKNVDFFIILFAGDILKKNILKKYKDIFVTNQNINVIVSDYEEISYNTNIKSRKPFFEKTSILTWEKNISLNKKYGNWQNSPISHCYRGLIAQEFRYSTDFQWASDWKFILEISKKYNIYYLKEVTAEFVMDNRKYLQKNKYKIESILEELFICKLLAFDTIDKTIYVKYLKNISYTILLKALFIKVYRSIFVTK